MTSNSPFIRFKDVYKYYYTGNEKVAALSGVSLEFQRGDFVSIMGPSGGGKTTFFKLPRWTGLSRPGGNIS